MQTAEVPYDPPSGLRRRRLEFGGNDAPSGGRRGTEDDDSNNNSTNSNINTENADGIFQQESPINNSNRNTATFSPLSGSIGVGIFRIPWLYCFVSVLSATLAIIVAPIPVKIEYHSWIYRGLNDQHSHVSKIATMIKSSNHRHESNVDANRSWSNKNDVQAKPWSVGGIRHRRLYTALVKHNSDGKKQRHSRRENILAEEESVGMTQRQSKKPKMGTKRNVWWTRWLKNKRDTNKRGKAVSGNGHDGKSREWSREGDGDTGSDNKNKPENTWNGWRWIDPVLLEYNSYSDIVTSVVDKVLRSTVRLIVLTNFMLAMTYMLHSAVAAWFLSYSGSSDRINNGQQHLPNLGGGHVVTVWTFASTSAAAETRERMGGFLVFKLLLISAVVAPDTLDLLILLTWFTLLSCLRSLDQLAHSVNAHLTAMGQPPKTGVVQLLIWVLACDVVAALSCVALFHAAGWGMVLLLTCDCALLGADAMSHILKYYQCVLEECHDANIQGLEARQLYLHNVIHDNRAYNDDDNVTNGQAGGPEDSTTERSGEGQSQATVAMAPVDVQQESRRLDRRIEDLELMHSQRMSIVDSGIFGLEMGCHILTVAHFCHIWSLHGVQFTLIDGVLALHLHSAISSACTKLARRWNVHSIALDIQGKFPDATDEELRKASISGDVCCICLGNMSTGGNVKKVRCGHLFHTTCLREVIERAQNFQTAKCPLCRASLVDNDNRIATASPTNENDSVPTQRNVSEAHLVAVAQQDDHSIEAEAEAVGVDAHIPNNGAESADGGEDIAPIHPAGGERALFRFSTESILPIWLPVPALSFELVRPALGAIQHEQIQLPTPVLDEPIDPIATPTANEHELNPELRTDIQNRDPRLQQQEQQQETRISFFQRLLILAGAMPMSPEEEARALAQLVDMFPQYDRIVLLRELRDRGSLEAVTEAILMDAF